MCNHAWVNRKCESVNARNPLLYKAKRGHNLLNNQ